MVLGNGPDVFRTRPGAVFNNHEKIPRCRRSEHRRLRRPRARVTSVGSATGREPNGQVASGFARFGLSSRAFIYLVIGWLALQIAAGHGSHEANQRGALADVARHSYGWVLLWILGVGFAAYALWRLSEAAFGTAAEGRGLGPRLRALVTGTIYAALCASTFAFIAGRSKQGQSQQQAALTARVMRHTGGRWVVGLVGAVVIGAGLVMIAEGVRLRFEKKLRMVELRGKTRIVVVGLGAVGTVARGLVFSIAGALVIDAAVTFNAGKSSGLDGALRTLANRPYGPELLGAVALGLLAFAAYACAEVRWAKT